MVPLPPGMRGIQNYFVVILGQLIICQYLREVHHTLYGANYYHIVAEFLGLEFILHVDSLYNERANYFIGVEVEGRFLCPDLNVTIFRV